MNLVSQRTREAVRAKLPPNLTFIIVVAALLAAMYWATEAALDVYEAVAAGDGIEQLDQPALRDAVASRTPTGDTIAVVLTELAGRIGTPVLGVIALALFTWRRRDWTPTLLLVPGLLGSLLLTVLGKDLADRARPPRADMVPPIETSPSFPSGHTLNATVLCVLVAYLFLITARTLLVRATALVVCAIDPLLVGASRVYLAAHWLTDVLAGLLVGTAWALAVILADRIWLFLRRRREADAPRGSGSGSAGGATAVPPPAG